jgi:hypothetical protein
MHPALQRLFDANAALVDAQRALELAQDQRRQAALALAEIEDEDQRWQAAIFAYREFGQGLSLALAQAATGLPGKKAQSSFLVRAGRKSYQPKGHGSDAVVHIHEPLLEWPAPDHLEREVISAHIAHGERYWVDRGLGWGNLRVDLQPDQARAYLVDPTGTMAARVGLTRDEFVEWLSSEGSIRCDAVTQKGSPCKAGVKGVSGQMRIGPWREAKDRGGFCGTHGG